jgi:hypothetical protein
VGVDVKSDEVEVRHKERRREGIAGGELKKQGAENK